MCNSVRGRSSNSTYSNAWAGPRTPRRAYGRPRAEWQGPGSERCCADAPSRDASGSRPRRRRPIWDNSVPTRPAARDSRRRAALPLSPKSRTSNSSTPVAKITPPKSTSADFRSSYPAVAGNRPFTTNNTTPASVRQRGTTFDLRPLTTTPVRQRIKQLRHLILIHNDTTYLTFSISRAAESRLYGLCQGGKRCMKMNLSGKRDDFCGNTLRGNPPDRSATSRQFENSLRFRERIPIRRPITNGKGQISSRRIRKT